MMLMLRMMWACPCLTMAFATSYDFVNVQVREVFSAFLVKRMGPGLGVDFSICKPVRCFVRERATYGLSWRKSFELISLAFLETKGNGNPLLEPRSLFRSILYRGLVVLGWTCEERYAFDTCKCQSTWMTMRSLWNAKLTSLNIF